MSGKGVRVQCGCGRFARYDAYYARWWCDRCDRAVTPPKVERAPSEPGRVELPVGWVLAERVPPVALDAPPAPRPAATQGARGVTIVDNGTYTATRDLGEHGTLTFRDKPRRAYYIEPPGQPKGQRCVSVTTVLGVLDKGEGLRRWQMKLDCAGVMQALRAGEIDPQVHHDDEAAGIVRALGLGADGKRDSAAEDGLTIHDALATWSQGGNLPDPRDLTIRQRPFLQSLARLLLALDPQPTAVEQLTCHPGLTYAGRFDLRATVDGTDTLLDLKVRERPSTRETDCLQLVGYAAAEHALGAPWPERMLAVAIGPDGTFIAHDVDLPRDAFEKVLAVYRLLADVRRPLDAARRAAQKAAANA